MSQPLLAIRDLNLERYGHVFHKDKFDKTFYSELKELTDAFEANDEYEIIDAANDLIVVLGGLITQKGYNPQLTLKDTVKEITARKQDPVQKQRWKDSPELQHQEKWEKDRNQDVSTLYKANYNTCKLTTK